MRPGDTIAAVSTPLGHGGIGIVRISGPDALGVAGRTLVLKKSLTARVATLAVLPDEHGQMVDETVVTWFAGPRSFTGEDVVEIACHGSPAILRHCLTRAAAAGARFAGPGEFTLRAFLNGRIDLPRAEAVRELIESTTLHQAKVAARQTTGSVSKQLMPIKAELLELIALLEAGIDFAEDDISVAPPAEILRRLDSVLQKVIRFAGTFQYGRILREGFSLAIAGRPNAGKSSLFNALLRHDRAIVTDIPGTTRDLISEVAEIEGVPVRLLDTAGIRESAGAIERIGIGKTFEAIADADLILAVVDGAEPEGSDEADLISRCRSQGVTLVAANKADLPEFSRREGALAVSAITGEGIEQLRRTIAASAGADSPAAAENGIVTSARHRKLLEETTAMLEKCRAASLSELPHELLLLDLYCALRPLDEITGATTADDILNSIFSSFCIGK